MNAPLLTILPQSQPSEGVLAQKQSARDNNSKAFDNNAFLGSDYLVSQNSFLALLLGQNPKDAAIDLEALGIRFSAPAKNDKDLSAGDPATANAVAAGVASLNVGALVKDAGLQGDIPVISSFSGQQAKLIEFNQKIQEFLGSLIDYAQSLQVQGQNAAPSAVVVEPETNTNMALSTKGVSDPAQAPANNEVAQPKAVPNLADFGLTIQNPKLEAQITSLIQQDPEAFIRQAALITSGISIPEIGTIQNGLTARLNQIATQALNDSSETDIKSGDKPLIFASEDVVLRRPASPVAQAALSGQADSGANGASGQMSGLSQNASVSQAAAAAMTGGQAQPQTNSFQMLMDVFLGSNFIQAQPGMDASADPASTAALQHAASADAAIARAAANPVLTAPQAAAPNPASEAVALQMQRFASKEGDTRFRIDMDPPQLGKVEVELKISKNGSLSANLMIEKPETYMMLQRDSGLLQKAMAEMGFDTAADSFNFQMAEGGGDTGGGSQGSDTGNGSQAGFGMDGAGELVSAQMNQIFIDPETGFVRVNIMA